MRGHKVNQDRIIVKRAGLELAQVDQALEAYDVGPCCVLRASVRETVPLQKLEENNKGTRNHEKKATWTAYSVPTKKSQMWATSNSAMKGCVLIAGD